MTRRIKDALTAERALSPTGKALGLHRRYYALRTLGGRHGEGKKA
jgi:hypothetical protein